MVTDNSQTKRINVKLIELIEDLQNQMQEKARIVNINKEITFPDASLELYNRILRAGGLKKV